MANFSMNLNSLSTEAQRFLIEKSIENGDGVMTTSERNKLADFLSGNEPFPEEYITIKDELINFASQFDEASSEQGLSKKEKASVRGDMSEREMMLSEENGILKTKNQKLLAENKELKMQIEEFKANSIQA